MAVAVGAFAALEHGLLVEAHRDALCGQAQRPVAERGPGAEEIGQGGVVGAAGGDGQVLGLGGEDLGASFVDEAVLEGGQDVGQFVDQGAGHCTKAGAAVG